MLVMSLERLMNDFNYSQLITIPAGVDLEIFREFVKPVFNPRDIPNAMVVGATNFHEERSIRKFFEVEYGIKESKIAGCNIWDVVPETEEAFDYFVADKDEGDATKQYVWDTPLQEMNSQNPGFDLVYIRNPSFIGLEEHKNMFRRSLCNLSDNGVLATLVRKDDQKEYENFLEKLQKFIDMEEIYSGPTGIELDGSNSLHNPYHTIGVFRK